MTLTAKYTSGRLALWHRKVRGARKKEGTGFLAVFCLAFFIFISHFPTYVAIAFGEMFCNF